MMSRKERLQKLATKSAKKTESPKLTPVEIASAATNNPSLSPDEFQLGNKTFKVVDLPYDDYISFLTLISPALENVVGGITSRLNKSTLPGLDLDTSSLNLTSLVTLFGKVLPELAQICCKQTEPDISIKEIKELAKTPFNMAKVVMVQIKRNNMIQDFADFFAQVLPQLKKK